MRARPTRQGIDRARRSAVVRASSSAGCSASLELFVIGAALVAGRRCSALARRGRAPAAGRGQPLDPAVRAHGRRRRARRGARRADRARRARRRSSSSSRSAPTARRGWPSRRSAPDAEVSAGYRIPTERRGVLTIGPLTAVPPATSLGLARSTTIVAGVDEVLVSPRAHLLDMPPLGQGVLGRHLLALAQRLGPGDFHSLRDYVDGDEPRTIHWRASARSENLKVRQHSVEGLRRCLVAARPARRRRARPATRRSSGPSPPPPASCTAPTGPG